MSGKPRPLLNKQSVCGWLKVNPGSDYKLPQDIIDKTITKHKEMYVILVGKELG